PSPKEYGLPNEARLKFMGVGLSQDEKQALLSAQSIWAAMFVAPQSDAIAATKRADQVLMKLADLSHGVICDETTRRYYSPKWWKTKRLAAWEGDLPDAYALVSIDFYRVEEKGSYRAISLGMSKLGLPEVVVNEMIQDNSRSISSLMYLAM